MLKLSIAYCFNSLGWGDNPKINYNTVVLNIAFQAVLYKFYINTLNLVL